MTGYSMVEILGSELAAELLDTFIKYTCGSSEIRWTGCLNWCHLYTGQKTLPSKSVGCQKLCMVQHGIFVHGDRVNDHA